MTSIDVTLRIGDVFATDRQAIVRTVLGSCIAVCLYDPVSRVGGMNHFMLPRMASSAHALDATRYGEHAMEVLIGSIQRLGGRRERLLAKLFGAGHVLQTKESAQSVPAQNISFIEQFAHEEALQVVSRDLGGFLPRRVHFQPHSGRVLVKRLTPAALDEVRSEERVVAQAAPARPAADITLF